MSKPKFEDLTDREIDALVAMYVMGIEIEHINFADGSTTFRVLNYNKKDDRPIGPHYSTNIADAWTVAETVDLLKGNMFLYKTNGDEWEIGRETGGYDNYIEKIVSETTAPKAICHAVLRLQNIVE